MNAFEWAQAKTGSAPPNDFHCETRDIAQSRIETLQAVLLRNEWSEDQAGLLSAIVGELTGNCFDHNLGKWRDIPGCWLQTEVAATTFRAIIADRGQGVLTTLRQVLPELNDPEEALRIGFTQTITGRAPEQRGNGLKFVVRSLQQLNRVDSFKFVSDNAKLEFVGSVDILDIPGYIGVTTEAVPGTYTEMEIRKNI